MQARVIRIPLIDAWVPPSVRVGSWRARRTIRACVRRGRATSTLVRQLLGAAQIIMEDHLQPAGDAGVEDSEVDLLVQLEGAPVEVRATDDRPRVIDDHRLRVQQRRPVLEDAYAGLQQRPDL